MEEPYKPLVPIGEPAPGRRTARVPELTPEHQKLVDEMLAARAAKAAKAAKSKRPPPDSKTLQQKARSLAIKLVRVLEIPNGAKCQRCLFIVTKGKKVEKSGKPYQCPQPAREGFPVCPRHGAGFPSREAAGEKENPATVNVTTGQSTRPDVFEQFVPRDPRFFYLLQRELDERRLLDYSEEVAATKALWRRYAELHGIEDVDMVKSMDSPAIKLATLIMNSLAVGEKCLKIEEAMGPISHEMVQRLVDAFGVVIRVFVQEADRDAAYALFQRAANRQSPALNDASASG